jgi:hypothetical protein
MALSFSTGFRQGQMGSAASPTGNPVQDLLGSGVINIYAGTAPADADAAITGTLLVAIDNESTATLFGEPTAGTIGIKGGETWQVAATATGTASFFRYVIKATDDDTLSTTQVRIQGTIGTSGSDIIIGNTTVTSGAMQTIDQFDLTAPAS